MCALTAVALVTPLGRASQPQQPSLADGSAPLHTPCLRRVSGFRAHTLNPYLPTSLALPVYLTTPSA
eukprot:scaffold33952_cov84-Isochrysis_galbana.AAC.1